MERFYREFGTRLRRARGERLSQAQLARQVGMSRGSIANIEVGRQRVPLHMLEVLARELGVEPCTLLPDRQATADAVVPADRLERLHSLDVTAVEKLVRRAWETREGANGET